MALAPELRYLMVKDFEVQKSVRVLPQACHSQKRVPWVLYGMVVRHWVRLLLQSELERELERDLEADLEHELPWSLAC